MTTPVRVSPSVSAVIGQLITNYLGVNYPHGGSVGATLNALRTRLRESPSRYDNNRDLLCWEVRESIRTEFFKIRWPTPPSPALLNLVTRTDILLTNYNAPTRPFYFPGARLAVPSPDPKRRMSATVLQLKYSIRPGQVSNEALVHLDGPNGGGFQWVATPNCMLLEKYAAPYAYPQPLARKQLSAAQMRKYARSAKKVETVESSKVDVRKESVLDTKGAVRREEFTEHARSPPPRLRLREDVAMPILGASGSLYDEDTDDEEIVIAGDDDIFPPEPLMKRLKHPKNYKIISKIVARRRNKLRGPLSQDGVTEYLIEWAEYPDDAKLSWESRSALLMDVPALVLEFDARYPARPAEVSLPVGPRLLADAYEDSDLQPDRNKVVGQKRKLAPGEAPPPVPAYLESPLLELSFSGMILHLRPKEWKLFPNKETAQQDARARKLRYKAEYPKFADYVFPLTLGDVADRERMKSRKILESTVKGRKQLVRWPKILGGVLLTDRAHPVSASCIARAPPSWESYFLSLGLQCIDWEREYVPHTPTAPEVVRQAVEEANEQLLQNCQRIHAEGPKRVKKESMQVYARQGKSPINGNTGNGAHAGPGGDGEKRKAAPSDPADEERKVAMRPLLFSRMNPDFAKALAKTRSEADGSPKYYDPIWCCWRKRTG